MDGVTKAYALLGLHVSASRDEVTRSFRALAKQHHPDRGGDRRVFEAIYAAYELLRTLPVVPVAAVRRPNPFMVDATPAPVVAFDAYDSRRRVPRAVTFEEELARAMSAAA